MNTHERLCKQAETAIDAVCDDTSVPASTTRVSLFDLIEYAKTCLDAVKEQERKECRGKDNA